MFFGIKLLVATGFTIWCINWLKVANNSVELKLVVSVFMLRLLLASLHEVTYVQIVGGLSVNSLFSLMFTIITTVFLIYRRYPLITSKKLWSVKLYIFLLIMTGLFMDIAPVLVEVAKWLLFINIVVLLSLSYKKDGVQSVFWVLTKVYLFPVFLLMLSILLGVSKASEADGSTSYVGGFYHEAVFSVLVFTSLFVTLMTAILNKVKFTGVVILLIFYGFLLLMINYRTTVLAYLVLTVVGGVVGFLRLERSRKLILFFLFSCVVVGVGGEISLGERFEEIPLVLDMASDLMVPYEQYYVEDAKLFSGRLYIWSQYITAWSEGSYFNQVLGFGAGSWSKYFDVYAHNTFVSILFESGVFGVVLITSLFLAVSISLVNGVSADVGMVAVSTMVGFWILNIATMPLWQVEGVLLFSLIISLEGEGKYGRK